MAKDDGYKLPPDFEENTKEPLVDFTLNDSTELWLINWPKDQNPDFDGQEVSFKLNQEGKLGSFVGTSGKDYDVVSGPAQELNARVFVSSTSGTKVAGKISRRVSFVHYPEPSELEEKLNSKKLKQMHKESLGDRLGDRLTQSPSMFATPTRSSMPTSSRPASSHSSKPKSSLYSVGEPSQHPKKRHAPEPTRSTFQASQNSGRSSAVNSSVQGHSGVSSTGKGHSAATSSGKSHSPATSSGLGLESKSRKKSKGGN